MFLDDGRAQPKSNTRAFQVLCGEEGIEDPLHVLRGNADSLIGHGDANGRFREIAPQAGGGNLNPYLSLRKRCFDSIANQIGKDLPQLSREAFDQQRGIPVLSYMKVLVDKRSIVEG
jgi:hypothetical protein